MKYYPISEKWKKVKPFTEDENALKSLTEDFNKFTLGIWGSPFTKGMLPEDIESCDWRYNGRRGRMPEYWKFVKHGACHWIVNFTLQVAMLCEPKKEWRIITTQKHSTVWDGRDTLFDFNFSALGIDPNDAFKMAYTNGAELKIGEKMKTHSPSI